VALDRRIQHIDYGAAAPETLMVTNIVMFIGGGGAGTAGGIRITAFLLLAFSIWNEVRGRGEVTVANRSISASSQRQELSVALLGVAAVAGGMLALLLLTDYSLEKGPVRVHFRVRPFVPPSPVQRQPQERPIIG
jgi:trk system potassium uptake protein TrkH